MSVAVPIIVVIVFLLVVLALAAFVAAVVVVGMQGRGRDRMPEAADRLARVAQAMNGDAEPRDALRTLSR